MNSPIDNIVIYNGYPLSVVIAVSFHSLLLALLLYLQSNRAPEAMEIVQPTIIKALFIDENPQVVNQQNAERQRLERVEQQRIAREQEQREVEQEKVAAEQQAAAERAEEREQAALVERQQLEQQQTEKLKQEQEKRVAEERQRQRELAEAEKVRQQQQVEEQQRQQEQAQAEAARTEYELVQSATALIQQVVQENWSRPPSARNGMSVELKIRMLPTGELVDARITKSSGDPAFDRSAETAVIRAAPFRELSSLPINVFNANFRTLTLTFRPEDLLN